MNTFFYGDELMIKDDYGCWWFVNDYGSPFNVSWNIA